MGDDRTLVDQTLDRVRNHRAAAALILAAVTLSALAGLTDAARRLGGLLPAPRPPSVAGAWATRPTGAFYGYERAIEFTLDTLGRGEVTGTVRVRGPDGALAFREAGLAEGGQTDDAVRLRWRGNIWLLPGAGGPSQPVDETVRARVAGDTLRGVYQRDGHAPVPFVAYRTRPAGTE